jgi:hypothetical protein
MQSTFAPQPARHLGHLVGGTLVGVALMAMGVGIAFLTIGTPLAARLVPSGYPGSSQLAIGTLVWSFAIMAGAALMLVSGANQLVVTVESVRLRTAHGSPLMRALRELPDDIAITTGVAPEDDRSIPQLAIGLFGVAVFLEVSGPDRTRRVGGSWEARTGDRWVPTENPLDRVARDAEQVRRWLIQGDLDFVVRVHAALVTPDASIPRSSGCAVISAEQIPAWIAALPPQRTLSASRCAHLLARLREAVAGEVANRGW